MTEIDLPKDLAERYGPWVLIAGGSEGIGAAFARLLAGCGCNLILLARRSEPLEHCAASLRQEFSVEVLTLSIDLTTADPLTEVRRITDSLEIGLLIYNAGASNSTGRFLELPPEQHQSMVQINCSVPISFAWHYGNRMKTAGRGGMIFLTSIAGLAGCSWQAVYSSTKAFDHIFAESLWHELKPHGVDVLGLAAGATLTPAAERLGLDFSLLNPKLPEGGAMSSEAVAIEGLQQLGQLPFWVAGEQNRNAAQFMMSWERPAIIDNLSTSTAMISGVDD